LDDVILVLIVVAIVVLLILGSLGGTTVAATARQPVPVIVATPVPVIVPAATPIPVVVPAAEPDNDEPVVVPGPAVHVEPDYDEPVVVAPSGGLYVVQRGDTLFRIARRFGRSLQAILVANPSITNPNLIRPGQQLVIP
jgi:LysM repeat protein